MKKILIVEDDSLYLKELKTVFNHEEFDIIEANNGQKGLKMALLLRPDLILLDILLPKMNGMTVLKRLRAYNGWGKKVPVIIITVLRADNDKLNKDIATTEPAYYLVKTCCPLEDVAAKVKEVLNKSSTFTAGY